MATSLNFTKTAGGVLLTLTQPTYDIRITGPPKFGVRTTTTVVPNASGAIVTGDGLAEPAALVCAGKVFASSRSVLATNCHNIWALLYAEQVASGDFKVAMSNGGKTYTVVLVGVSGEYTGDTGDLWGTVTIDLLILDPPNDIA